MSRFRQRKEPDPDGPELSIGKLARLTGIDTHRLRMWERRYGRPRSHRLPSGHRRYGAEEVSRLNLVRLALDAKLRPAQVVPASTETLEQLLAGIHGPLAGRRAEAGGTGYIVETLISFVVRYQAQAFTERLHNEMAVRGPFRFVCDIAGPLITRIGDGWSAGELSIGHEHFATNLLSDFLASAWRNMNERCQGPVFVLATLQGERHSLGIQMCAVVTALAKRRVVFLGSDLPHTEISRIANDLHAQALCLSLSMAMPPQRAATALRQLRDGLPSTVPVIAGGRGAVANLPGIEHITEFQAYLDRLL